MENNSGLQSGAQSQQKSGKSRRGFASMDKNRHKEVSSRGGKSPRTQFTGRENSSPTPGSNAPHPFQ